MLGYLHNYKQTRSALNDLIDLMMRYSIKKDGKKLEIYYR